MMEERSTKAPDMEAAQQLVQLSGGEEEESKGLINHGDGQKEEEEEEKKEKEEEGEDLSKAEIFGRGRDQEEMEQEEKHRLRKRKRFRSLAAIYEASKPISGNGHHGRRKKRLQRGKDQKGLGD